METKRLSIQEIVVKGEIQQRVDQNQECVNDYTEEIAKGTRFPALDVFFDGKEHLLADGLHRLLAYKLAGVETVDVIVHDGDIWDAILYAAGANAEHGLRRTNADKRKAVTTILTGMKWQNWADGLIAEKCRVSQPFVSRIRAELTQKGFESSSTRVGKDGRTIDTSNIGKKAQDSDPANAPTETEQGANEPSPETAGTDRPGDDESGQSSSEGGASDTPKASEAETDSQTNRANQEAGTSQAERPATGNAPVGGEESQGGNASPTGTEGNGKDKPQSAPTGTKRVNPDALNQRIIELQNLIKEKDQRIKELESENEYLKRQLEEYAKQAMIPKPSNPEGTRLEERVS
jgi:hypothetical protein